MNDSLSFPKPDEHDAYFERYTSLARETHVLQALREDRGRVSNLYQGLTVEQCEYRYREGAWTLKELLQHITDTERIFTYRALCIARGDQGPFPGYDPDDYMVHVDVKERPTKELVADFLLARNGLISTCEGFSEADWARRGISGGSPLSVRAIPFIMLGHMRHHHQVILDRYLV